jgi:DNA-directed RNA polymerase specialized sigma24 family protein
MSRKTYQLNVTREGKWWIVDAVDVDYRTQAQTLSEVDEMGRDLIAGALDVPADSFDLDVRVEQPADVAARLAEASGLDREAQAVASRAALGRREAARTLRDAYGLSAIDTARVLGVTRGRVYQLLDEREKASA